MLTFLLVAIALAAPLPPNAGPTGELVILGPFGVDDFYKSKEQAITLDQIEEAGGPSKADMLKTLSGWKIYILDRKVKDGERWIWDRPAGKSRGEYPKLLLDGKSIANLKDKNGKDFPFTLESPANEVCNLNQGSVKKGILAQFELKISATIVMREIEVPIGKGAKAVGTHWILETCLFRYDVTGKHEFIKPKSEK